MANNYFVPFNNMPTTSVVKTSPHTVQAGYYARVKPLYYDFTLDGVSPMLFSSSTSIAGGTTTGQDFYIGEKLSNVTMRLTISGGTGFVFVAKYKTAVTSMTLSGNVTDFVFNESTGLFASVTAAHHGIGAFYATLSFTSIGTCNLSAYKNEIDWIWVPTGAVLAGSKYIVEEYPILI